MSSPDPSESLDHIVVLMFENRSFDNLLGYLYTPEEKKNFDGLYGKSLSNPVPEGSVSKGRTFVPVHQAENMDAPDPDPGEEYPHVNTQMYGSVSPEDNRYSDIDHMAEPYNLPVDPDDTPPMNGFVLDYINHFKQEMWRKPRYEEYAQIMQCYGPGQVPVLSTMARGFATFDHWFCEVPSQTYANRSFFHAASSSGYVVNYPTGKFCANNTAPTIFEKLEEKGLPWKVYIDAEQMISATALIHANRLIPKYRDHFAWMSDFYEDVRNGNLPAYSFIEPNMLYPHTDMHPPLAARLRNELHLKPPQHIRGGEQLMGTVYDAIRKSSSMTGSNWANTFLLITFDEHGGTYDHVPPPKVPNPGDTRRAEMNFDFTRSGLRVPTIAVSAWIDEGTVINEEYRHTSMISTLMKKWDLGDHLTARDASARDLSGIFNRDTPRKPEDWPLAHSLPWTFHESIFRKFMRPLSRMETDLLGEAMHFMSLYRDEYSIGGQQNPTRRKAKRWMKKIRKELFH